MASALKRVPQFIKTLRKEMNYTQKDLAVVLDVCDMYVSRVECGYENNFVGLLQLICGCKDERKIHTKFREIGWDLMREVVIERANKRFKKRFGRAPKDMQ